MSGGSDGGFICSKLVMQSVNDTNDGALTLDPFRQKDLQIAG